MALVAQSVWTALVVAAGDLSDPVGRVACHFRDSLGGFALGKKPEYLEMAAGDWSHRLPIALLQLGNAQMIFQFYLSWHTPSIPPDLILYLFGGGTPLAARDVKSLAGGRFAPT